MSACLAMSGAIACFGKVVLMKRVRLHASTATCHIGHERQSIKVSSDARLNTPLSDVHATKQGQPELCLTCHQMRRAQLQRSSGPRRCMTAQAILGRCRLDELLWVRTTVQIMTTCACHLALAVWHIVPVGTPASRGELRDLS
jgi:hypothetical protein